MRKERLVDRHTWWRVADPAWRDPLDPSFARVHGGRWNAPNSHSTLYLNEDVVTARMNLRAFISKWPYEPEDLRDEMGPQLIGARLPRAQTVCDVHSPIGVAQVGLHQNYPFDLNGKLVPHAPCQAIGETVKTMKLRGIRARSAQARDGAGRELAWFPASDRSRARKIESYDFEQWYWS